MPTPVPWHIAGIYRPLPGSRVLSEEQRKTGYLRGEALRRGLGAHITVWLVAYTSLYTQGPTPRRALDYYTHYYNNASFLISPPGAVP
jgi:hypothetical protein